MDRSEVGSAFKQMGCKSVPQTAAALLKCRARGVAPADRAFRRRDMEAGTRIFGDAVFGPGGFDRLPETRKEQVLGNLTNVKAELLGSGYVPLAADRVRGVQAPTLLVTGRQSIALFRHLTNRIEELLPRTERIEIHGASHIMHEDNAPAYNAAVLSFLTGRRKEA